jgi:hypothetical protein
MPRGDRCIAPSNPRVVRKSRINTLRKNVGNT